MSEKRPALVAMAFKILEMREEHDQLKLKTKVPISGGKFPKSKCGYNNLYL